MNPQIRRPTLHHVAERANVSIKTVSRVVNGEPFVSDATAARVNEAVKELGYRRDHIASTLKRDFASATIGLVVADVSNPFFSSITRTVENQALDAGHLLFTVSSDEDPEREREVIDRLFQRRVDGLMVATARRDHSFLRREQELGTVFVFIDRPPVRLRADTVLIDNYRGSVMAVKHLLDAGHRRIAFLSDPLATMYTAAERYRGYADALAESGVAVDEGLVAWGLHTPDAAAAFVSSLLESDSPPTAFFATNNRTAVGAANALADRPDVGLVGFDDIEFAEALARPVTVVTYDLEAFAKSAADMLFERLSGYDGKPRRVMVPTTLTARRT